MVRLPGSSEVRRFTDSDDYTSSIRAARMEVAITERGRFASKLVRIDLRRLWMQRNDESLGRIAYMDCVPGRAIIWFAARPDSNFLSENSEVPAAAIVRNNDGYNGFQRSIGRSHKASMSLPIADMEALGATFGGADLTPPRDRQIVVPPSSAMARLRSLHAAAGLLAEHSPEIIACPEAARGLEQALIAAMADCLCTAETPASGAENHRQGATMRRFYAMLEANTDGVIHVPEICRELGISNRTLTTYTNETLGMSPYRFLKLRQLQLARRALLRGDPLAATVTMIATDHGFWDLGRFASAYRELFGELPSTTLHRGADRREA